MNRSNSRESVLSLSLGISAGLGLVSGLAEVVTDGREKVRQTALEIAGVLDREGMPGQAADIRSSQPPAIDDTEFGRIDAADVFVGSAISSIACAGLLAVSRMSRSTESTTAG